MKKNYLIIGLAAVSMGFFAFQNDSEMKESVISAKAKHMFGGGGQSALTGAPGENNCTQCHSGSVLDGSQENVFAVVNAQFQPVTEYNPGDTYTVSVDLVSDPAKKGFSATALDGTDAMAGSFTESGIGGTQDFSAGGRDYVSHTNTSNTSSTQLWAWTWTAPATNVGDVTFYVASNSANDDGATSGDMIYLSEHTIGSFASVNEESIAESSFNAGYNASANKVVVDFTSLTSGDMFFNLVDMNGKSVYSKSMSSALVGENKHSVMLPASIDNGMYVVNFFVGNKAMSANILVQK
jgi:hypothetical protein